jgi:prevent-host-death family protein
MLEAKNKLSKLLKAVSPGEDVVISSNVVPMVRLVRVTTRRKPRQPGTWSKLPAPAPDWDAPEFNRQIADQLAGKRVRCAGSSLRATVQAARRASGKC